MREDLCKMLEGKKAFIFDLDGTLVDSMWMWKAIDVEFLGRYGYDCPDDLQKAIEGMSFSETAAYFRKRFSLPLDTEEIKAVWTDMTYEKYKTQVPLKPGALMLLDYAKARKIPCAIATSNGRKLAEAVLQSLNIQDRFELVITACQVKCGKPAPDIYLKAAEILKVQNKDCLVFEDVPAGIMAGKEAGMTVCAVEDAFSASMRQEKQELADYFLCSFEEFFR